MDLKEEPRSTLSSHDRRLMEWVRIRERLAELRESALSIVIDGDPGDWDGFFWGRCEVQRPTDGAPVPLLLAIAPVNDAILFCIKTEPSADCWWSPWSELGLRINVQSPDWDELNVILRRGSGESGETTTWAWIGWRHEQRRVGVPKWGVRHSWGECIEGRVDLLEFDLESRSASLELLRDAARHPWIRVWSELREAYDTRKLIPHDALHPGPAVASYRLDPDEFQPSWADAVPGPLSAVHGAFPLGGRWFVVGGENHWKTHVGITAYDLRVLDQRGCDHPAGDASRLRARFSWDREVLAPRDGFLALVIDDKPDATVSSNDTSGEASGDARPTTDGGNWLAMEDDLHRWWRFGHLRQGSAPSRGGNPVNRGDLIARVGNSGSDVGPHLHMDAAREWLGRTVPIVLEDVVVGLNAADDDPWVVHLPEWEIEAGYFVRRAADGR